MRSLAGFGELVGAREPLAGFVDGTLRVVVGLDSETVLLDGAVTLNKFTFGQRTWDVNKDGVANYGLVPDWIEDVRKVGGQQVADDMLRGAEQYLRTWGATTG